MNTIKTKQRPLSLCFQNLLKCLKLLFKADSHNVHLMRLTHAGRQLRFHRDRNFFIFLRSNFLPQLHAEYAACLNEPFKPFNLWSSRSSRSSSSCRWPPIRRCANDSLRRRQFRPPTRPTRTWSRHSCTHLGAKFQKIHNYRWPITFWRTFWEKSCEVTDRP